MKKQITLQNKKIDYTLKKSAKARRMRLAVYCDGSVVITAPHGLNETITERFIKEKTGWLLSKLAFFGGLDKSPFTRHSYKDYIANKEKALLIISKKTEILAKKQGYCYNKINIKNQKTRWGSCSRRGNLNFNYKVIFLPEKIQDYIIAHELCHLREFNHSRKFWNLVEKIIPNYSDIRKELKKNRINFS